PFRPASGRTCRASRPPAHRPPPDSHRPPTSRCSKRCLQAHVWSARNDESGHRGAHKYRASLACVCLSAVVMPGGEKSSPPAGAAATINDSRALPGTALSSDFGQNRNTTDLHGSIYRLGHVVNCEEAHTHG